ncbi:MAG TPA: hypothetical protein VGL72_11970 [Bryobacteraceae bacterium]|jgi:hypothetical protein
MTLWLLGLSLLAAGPIPTFDQFRVAVKFTGKPADPVLRTRTHQEFRTAIREAAAKGLNFAGHYTIAGWGCGAGCVSMVVVDNSTGRVLDAPFSVLAFDVGRSYEGGEEQLEHRPDSSLLIARGCPEEKNCGTYYYEWSANRFKLLRKTPAPEKK